MSKLLKVVGMDPSLRNWGLAVGYLNTVTHKITIDTISVINPVISNSKQVRQNSIY